MKADTLFEVFAKYLETHTSGQQTREQFIEKVVSEYFSHIRSLGFISSQYESEIREDLEAEVLRMLKVKTYGQFWPTSQRFFQKNKKHRDI